MRIAITGGTGFVGRHLAARLTTAVGEPTTAAIGEPATTAVGEPAATAIGEPAATATTPALPLDPSDIVLISRRTGVSIDDADALTRVMQGCDVVVHCAGINRELGDQTYDRVHVEGTRAVVEAARRVGATRIVMLSFLRARPDCGSAYHESKWAAEELVRASGLDHTILKAGMIYGRGDHLVDHVSHAVQTLPLFTTVGLRERTISPVPVAELVEVLVAAAHGRLPNATVRVVGAEELVLSEAVRRIARIVGKRVLILPAPVFAVRVLAQLTELTMRVPLIAKAQARMLAEGVSVAAPPTPDLPTTLRPTRMFTDAEIRAALPPRGPFTVNDLRPCRFVRRIARTAPGAA